MFIFHVSLMCTNCQLFFWSYPVKDLTYQSSLGLFCVCLRNRYGILKYVSMFLELTDQFLLILTKMGGSFTLKELDIFAVILINEVQVKESEQPHNSFSIVIRFCQKWLILKVDVVIEEEIETSFISVCGQKCGSILKFATKFQKKTRSF